MATVTWTFRDNEQSNQAFEHIQEIRRFKHLCDVTLVTNDVEIACHKLVLASCSLYFYMKFVVGRTGDTLIMEGIESEILIQLINYIYSSKLSIMPQNVKELMLASNILMLPEVLKQCSDYLKESLNPKNCLEMAEWANNHKFLDLKSNAEDYIGLHFWDLIGNNEFLKASHQNFLVLVKAAKKDIVADMTLMEYILSWVDYDIAAREAHLDALLDYVDMSLMETDYLMLKLDDRLLKGNVKYITKATNVVRSKYKQGTHPSKGIVQADPSESNIEIFNHHKKSTATDQSSLSTGTSTMCTEPIIFVPRAKVFSTPPVVCSTGASTKCTEPLIFVPRTEVFSTPSLECSAHGNLTRTNLSKTNCTSSLGSHTENRDILVVAGRHGNKLSVERYNFKKRRWTEILISKDTPMNEGCAVTFLDSKIYLISGKSTSNIEVYDLASKQWIPTAPYLGKREFMGVTTLNGTIYSVGGYSRKQNSIYSTAKVYHQENETWESVKAMKIERFGHGLGVLNGKIYAVGGESGKGFIENVEYYNPVKNIWSPVKNMSIERYKPGVVELDGILYAIGGRETEGEMLETVEGYNPKNNTWTEKSDMHDEREGAGVIAYSKHIYAFGGRNKQGLLKSVEMYDPETDSWSRLPDMLVAKEDVAATLMDSVNQITRYQL